VHYFNLHTHTASNNPNVLDLVNQYPWEFDATQAHYSIGIHPWFIEEHRLESDFEILASKLSLAPCLAVGECGLDKRIAVPMELQLAVFERQIALAEAFQKPIVVHLVGAFQELLTLKKRLNIKVPLIIHGFSKNETIAKQLVAHGFYISFGKYLMQNPAMETVFKQMPLDRVFLETDTLALAVEEVYQVAASYKAIAVADLKQQINTNFTTVFKTNTLNL